jgi:multiple sugar transport system permease protein
VKAGRSITAFAFLSPNLLGFLAFELLPVSATVILSLFRWDLFTPPCFVGLQNFEDLLGFTRRDGSMEWNDPYFWKYLGNTLFLMLSIPLTMAGALLLAILLNQELRGRNLFRMIFFLPSISGGVGMLLLWRYVLNAEFGLINQGLAFFGIEGPNWLGSYHWAKPSLILISVWAGVGGVGMLIYLAALRGIPRELYEAAQIDGAGPWAKFRNITWPQLAPATFFIFVTSIIGGFQGGFSLAYVLTRGGPDGATTTIDYFIYQHGFEFFNMGYAAAIAVVLFAIVLLATLLQWRLGKEAVSDA